MEMERDNMQRIHDFLYNIVPLIPFMSVIKSHNDSPEEIKVNWSEILKTLIISALVASLGAYITITKLETKQEQIIKSNDAMAVKVDKICDTMGRVMERLSVVETRQSERIERERAQGLRK